MHDAPESVQVLEHDRRHLPWLFCCVDAPVLLATSMVAALATLVFGSIAAVRGRAAASLSPMAQAGGDTRASARTGGAAAAIVGAHRVARCVSVG